MPLQTGNLFSIDTKRSPEEQIDTLVSARALHVERIVSMGHASPEGFWYDDSRAEWVVLLSGAATLEFEVGPRHLDMRPGDYVLIESHCRHRVAWTHADEPSVWLAIYFDAVYRGFNRIGHSLRTCTALMRPLKWSARAKPHHH